MNLWIIYKGGNIISKLIAEVIQDYLEDYINVSVGNAYKIDPSLLLEEKLDYLIIGDFISETIPSVEVKNWVLKFGEISKKNNQVVKVLSTFYITMTDIKNDKLWGEFLKENINTDIIHPPILQLKLNSAELAQEIGMFKIVKDYSNDIIAYIINH